MNRKLTKLHLEFVASFALILGTALLAAQSVVAQKAKSTQAIQAPQAARPIDAKIVNTEAEPVPVTGTLTVGNTVNTQIAIPAGAFSAVNQGTGVLSLSGPDPAGTSYAITSITVANSNGTSILSGINALWGSLLDPGHCTGAGSGVVGIGPFVRVPPGETVHITFPQPFILRYQPFYPGPASCLTIGSAANETVTVVGYRF